MSIQFRVTVAARFAYLGAVVTAAGAVIALLLALMWRTDFGWVLFALWLLFAVCSLIVAIGAYRRANSDEASRASAGA